jgi:hypothetical protein
MAIEAIFAHFVPAVRWTPINKHWNQLWIIGVLFNKTHLELVQEYKSLVFTQNQNKSWFIDCE